MVETSFLQSDARDTETDYKTLSNESYAEPSKRRKGLDGGYIYDEELSTKHAAVYHRNGKPVVAYRGTADLADVGTDLFVAAGSTKHPRFQDAVALADKVKSKYAQDPELTGHSLGGTLAHHVSDQRGHEATVFNPGSNFLAAPRKTSSRVKVVRNAHDLISQGYAKTKEERKGSLIGTAAMHGIASLVKRPKFVTELV